MPHASNLRAWTGLDEFVSITRRAATGNCVRVECRVDPRPCVDETRRDDLPDWK